jgi:hypothetical protein
MCGTQAHHYMSSHVPQVRHLEILLPRPEVQVPPAALGKTRRGEAKRPKRASEADSPELAELGVVEGWTLGPNPKTLASCLAPPICVCCVCTLWRAPAAGISSLALNQTAVQLQDSCPRLL